MGLGFKGSQYFRHPTPALRPPMCACGRNAPAWWQERNGQRFANQFVRTNLCLDCWRALPPALLRAWAHARTYSEQQGVAIELRQFAASQRRAEHTKVTIV
jgi:hypothetical protein